jgi:uncharacterized protein (DUF433 family)
MDDVTKEIEDKEYKMNAPTVDPKSTEELAKDFQKELDKYKPTFDVTPDGPSGDPLDIKTSQEELQKMYPFLDPEKIQSSLNALNDEEFIIPELQFNKEKESEFDEIKKMYPFLDDDAIRESLGQVMVTVNEAGDQLGEMQNQIAQQISSGIGDAFADAIVDGKNFGESMKEVFNSLLKQIIKVTIETALLNVILQSMGLGGATSGGGGGLLGNLFSGIFGGSQQVNDIAFGPSAGRFITGPEGSFSLNPNDSIVAGTNLFGGQQNNNMTINGYIDGSSIFLSNTRQTNTINRLS